MRRGEREAKALIKLKVNEWERQEMRNGRRMEIEWMGKDKVEINGKLRIRNELKEKLEEESREMRERRIRR